MEFKYVVFYEGGIPFFSIKVSRCYKPNPDEGVSYREFTEEEWRRINVKD